MGASVEHCAWNITGVLIRYLWILTEPILENQQLLCALRSINKKNHFYASLLFRLCLIHLCLGKNDLGNAKISLPYGSFRLA